MRISVWQSKKNAPHSRTIASCAGIIIFNWMQATLYACHTQRRVRLHDHFKWQQFCVWKTVISKEKSPKRKIDEFDLNGHAMHLRLRETFWSRLCHSTRTRIEFKNDISFEMWILVLRFKSFWLPFHYFDLVFSIALESACHLFFHLVHMHKN